MIQRKGPSGKASSDVIIAVDSLANLRLIKGRPSTVFVEGDGFWDWNSASVVADTGDSSTTAVAVGDEDVGRYERSSTIRVNGGAFSGLEFPAASVSGTGNVRRIKTTITAPNWTALSTIAVQVGDVVDLVCHTSANDGGGGTFDVVDNTGGSYVANYSSIATNGTLALLRRDRLHATRSDWSGGVLQNAIDDTPSGGMLILPPGTFLARGLVVDRPMKIVGEHTTIKLSSAIAGTSPLFTVSSNGVSFEGITFDGDRYNQTGSHADNILFHRQHSAISTADVSCNDTTITQCIFKNHYNAAICHIGDRLKITNCTFQDTNTAPLIVGYHSSDNSVHSNIVQVAGCTFERTGYRTGPSDTREFGDSLPVVTGDAMLLRASNAIISGNMFVDTDRCSIKIEHLRENVTIQGNNHVNSYAGDSAYTAIGVQANASDFTPSATNLNNLVVSNEIARRPSGLFGVTAAHIYGIAIRDCYVNIPSGVGAQAIISFDSASYVSIDGCDLVTALTVPVVKSVSTGAYTRSDYYISRNRMVTAGGFGVQVNGAINRFRLLSNTIVSTANGIYGDSGVKDDFIISGNEMRDVRFVDGSASNRTNFLVERNLFEGYVESYISSVTCRDNLMKTVASGRTLIGLISSASGSYFTSDNAGEMATLAVNDTTPSVKGRSAFVTANTNPTSITTFDDAVVGVPFTIVFRDGNTTLVNSAGLRLVGGVDFVATDYDTITLMSVYGAGIVELCRTVL